MNARITALMAVLGGAAYAADDTQALADAPHVEQYLHVTFVDKDEPEFFFNVDEPGAANNERKLQAGQTFVADTGPGKGFSVVIGYLNPIEYSWSLSETASEDPTAASAKKFADALNSLALIVGAPGAGGVALPQEQAKALARASNVSEDKIEKIFSRDLLDWTLWLETHRNDCVASTPAQLETEFLTPLTKADRAIYGEPAENEVEIASAARFQTTAIQALQKLKAASSVSELRNTALPESAKLAAALEAANAKALKSLDEVEAAASKISWKTGGVPASCRVFQLYTSASIGNFVGSAKKVVEARKSLVSALTKLQQGVKTTLNTASREANENYFRVGPVIIDEGQMKDVTIIVRKRAVTLSPEPVENLNIEEKGESKIAIRVRPYQLLLLEFSPGVVFLPGLAYPKYGTEVAEGRTLVARSDDKPQRIAAVGMLSLIPRRLPWTVVQFGVGTAESYYPMLLAGAGLRLPSARTSLTLGAAWTWKQSLKTLQVGDEVSGTAAIDSDIIYTLDPKPAFFIGLQRGF